MASKNSHALMKSSLAKALIEAGVQHFDMGGQPSPAGGVSGPSMVGNSGNNNTNTNNVGNFVNSIPVVGTSNLGNQIIANPVNSLMHITDSNFQGQGANLQPGTNAAQINQAYSDSQGGLGMQGGIAAALNSQLNPAIQNQQTLAAQLLNQASGQGPNPAQDQLNQNTAANIANQGALLAGQRGAGANVGLIAKLAANQGAQTQQQSVGQAATLGAQQQLGAQKSLADLSSNQVNQAAGGTQQYNQNLLNEQQQLLNANSQFNNENVAMQTNLNNVNSATAQGNQKGQQGVLSGIMNGAASALSMFADGGQVSDQMANQINPDINTKDISEVPKYGMSMPSGGADASDISGATTMVAARGGLIPGKSKYQGNDLRNDVVPALLSKEEVVLPNSVTQSADPVGKAAEFMKHIMEEKKGKNDDYSNVAKAKKSLKDRVEHLEKLCMGGRA